ncbi:MAG TPA: hemolysin family protein [Chloroflexota bacterium]|nr:hemolysin family protein [Chloroflexota bacterium]
MELPPTAGLLAVALLLAANGFFVAAEFAIVAVRRSRLEQLAAEGRGDARLAMKIVAHLDTYIAACQVGITLASLVLGWIGEPALAHVIEPPVEALVGALAPAVAHAVSLIVSLALITSLHIIVGEQAPKGLALQRAEGVVLWTARPLQLFELLFRWPTWLLQKLTGLLLRLAGLSPVTEHGAVHSIEELAMLVSGSREAGLVEESEARIAVRAFSFADLTAGALMTPRTEVDAVPVDASPDVLTQAAGRSRHILLPVYQGSLDTIVGVLNVVDLYRALAVPAAPAVPAPSLVDVRRLLRPTMVVPESKPADDILEEMRTTGRHFAVVIDEYGGTAGILTLDDLLEAIVGPISEAPAPDGSTDPAQPAVAADGSVVVDGLTRLEEWEELTGVELTPDDHAQAETIGGVVMHRLGRIAAVGDELTLAGRGVRVEALDGLRVALVRLLPRPVDRQDPPDQAGAGGSPGERGLPPAALLVFAALDAAPGLAALAA